MSPFRQAIAVGPALFPAEPTAAPSGSGLEPGDPRFESRQALREILDERSIARSVGVVRRALASQHGAAHVGEWQALARQPPHHGESRDGVVVVAAMAARRFLDAE